jgi:hypothetical protein
MDTLSKIKANAVYKQVLADSYGGVMYNVANHDKYDTTELLKLWAGLTPAEREMAGGIMKGAMSFLRDGQND